MRIPGGVRDTEDDNCDREEPDRQQPEGRDVESLDLDDVGNEVERLRRRDGRARGTEPKRLGEAYGLQLALGSRSESEAIARLEPLGADYQVVGNHIQAGNCVFQEACASAREVVCGVQAGLLQGALAAAGSNRDVVPQGPDGGGGCNFEVG